MKKIILAILVFIPIFTMGCSSQGVSKAETLEDAYFSISNKLGNEGSISDEYISELLNSYSNSKSFEPGGAVEHSFQNKDELLTITYNSKGKLNKVAYSNEINENNFTFRHIVGTTPGEYEVFIKTTDIHLNEKVSSLLDSKNFELLPGYNEFYREIQSENNLKIDDISETLSIKPSSEYSSNPTKPYNTSYHTFKKDNERIKVTYLEDEKQIGHIKYIRENQNGEIEIEKEIYLPELTLLNDMEFIYKTHGPNADIQTNILEVLKK